MKFSVSIMLDDDMRLAVDEASARVNLGRAEWIRRAIYSALADQAGHTHGTGLAPEEVFAWDLAEVIDYWNSSVGHPVTKG